MKMLRKYDLGVWRDSFLADLRGVDQSKPASRKK
jgi:trehalose 6-phosphate synthase